MGCVDAAFRVRAGVPRVAGYACLVSGRPVDGSRVFCGGFVSPTLGVPGGRAWPCGRGQTVHYSPGGGMCSVPRRSQG